MQYRPTMHLRIVTLGLVIAILLAACSGDDGASSNDADSVVDGGVDLAAAIGRCQEAIGGSPEFPSTDGSGDWSHDIDDVFRGDLDDNPLREWNGLITDDLDALGSGDRARTGTLLTPDQLTTYLASADFESALTQFGDCEEIMRAVWTGLIERAATGIDGNGNPLPQE